MELNENRLDVAARAVCEGLDDPIAIMATLSALIYASDARFDWVGFYRNMGNDQLLIGPYQGGLACLEIPFSKGVCGYSAREKRAVIVPDVNAFEGHIACSSTTQSELVVPVINRDGALIAVLDIDSNQPDAFREADRDLMQLIVEEAFSKFPS